MSKIWCGKCLDKDCEDCGELNAILASATINTTVISSGTTIGISPNGQIVYGAGSTTQTVPVEPKEEPFDLDSVLDTFRK